MVSKEDKIYCSLLLGKARVVPKNFVSILRLEAIAAVLSVKLASSLKKELSFAKLLINY